MQAGNDVVQNDFLLVGHLAASDVFHDSRACVLSQVHNRSSYTRNINDLAPSSIGGVPVRFLPCFFTHRGAVWVRSLSSSPWRSPHWREPFVPCASRTASCRSRGSKVFPAERRRSDIQHLVLCRSSQRCSERSSQLPII